MRFLNNNNNNNNNDITQPQHNTLHDQLSYHKLIMEISGRSLKVIVTMKVLVIIKYQNTNSAYLVSGIDISSRADQSIHDIREILGSQMQWCISIL